MKIVKQIVDEQMKEDRSGAWAIETYSLAKSYGLDVKID